MHILVMAKAPVPGRVKTRLCPPCTPEQAARLAEAALADTLEAVARCGVRRRILALDGEPGAWLTSGFDVVAQAPGSFDERLAAGWVAAGGPGIHIGTDTPPVTAGLLELIDRQCWATRAQARRAIVEYIEAFYNRRRLHSSLQYLTPAEYELKIQPPQGRSRGIVRAPGEPGQPQWVRCCAWRRRCEGGGNASPNWRRHGSQCY